MLKSSINNVSGSGVQHVAASRREHQSAVSARRGPAKELPYLRAQRQSQNVTDASQSCEGMEYFYNGIYRWNFSRGCGWPNPER